MQGNNEAFEKLFLNLKLEKFDFYDLFSFVTSSEELEPLIMMNEDGNMVSCQFEEIEFQKVEFQKEEFQKVDLATKVYELPFRKRDSSKCDKSEIQHHLKILLAKISEKQFDQSLIHKLEIDNLYQSMKNLINQFVDPRLLFHAKNCCDLKWGLKSIIDSISLF